MAVARLSPQAVLAEIDKRGIPLVGLMNGLNLSFTTPDKFVTGTLKVFRNGARLREGTLNDYTVAESGGLTTGFDTVVFTAYPPKPSDNLTSDYHKQGA